MPPKALIQDGTSLDLWNFIGKDIEPTCNLPEMLKKLGTPIACLNISKDEMTEMLEEQNVKKSTLRAKIASRSDSSLEVAQTFDAK